MTKTLISKVSTLALSMCLTALTSSTKPVAAASSINKKTNSASIPVRVFQFTTFTEGGHEILIYQNFKCKLNKVSRRFFDCVEEKSKRQIHFLKLKKKLSDSTNTKFKLISPVQNLCFVKLQLLL